jgi:hypothetical protein
MSVSGLRATPKPRRLVSALALIFVFFLPLHFHPAAGTANVTHECACLHGARTQTGVVAVLAEPPAWLLQLFRPIPLQSWPVSQVVIGIVSIRAPPVFLA